ncbi:hypothetical protein LWC35_37355 [Pseudonocardia kujensis]|uniref:hypothetical protein n=1 Tax=Pseudonocardia kujensis TaxID=1128675 RepID=UPI001E4392F0|nr:hypothetical protein [Pseudonocardia kujensis]MCE0768521.1 hypothetical protein [Pseudonocardia kujensis]
MQVRNGSEALGERQGTEARVPAPREPSTGPVQVSRSSVAAEVALAAVALVLLGGTVLTYPFRGDQAIFALIGRQVLHGETLYTDLWDVKQPGVFLWYGLADALGLGETGARLLDVLAAVAFGACVWGLLRRRTSTPWVRRWLPVLATGVLLASAGPGDFGQPEMLCLVPAVGAFALVAADPDRAPGWARIVGAAVCVGVVGVFKLPLAAVAGLALLVFLALRLRGRARVVAVAVVLGAALVPVLLVLAWLAARGAGGAALRVWLVDALDMGAAHGSRSPFRLLEGLGRYCLWSAPVVLLAARRAGSAWRRRDALDLAMVAFAVLHVLSVAGQFGWWYQWYFLSAPLVLLALRGLDDLAPRLARGPRRGRAITLLAVACLPLLAHAASWTVPAVLDGGGLTAASRARIDERVAGYGTIRTEIAAAGVRPDDSLFVLGDPLYHLLADEPLVVRTNGWDYDLMADRQWRELAGEVAAARPTVVLVDDQAAGWLAERGPDLRVELARDYTPIRTGAEGTWYRLR